MQAEPSNSRPSSNNLIALHAREKHAARADFGGYRLAARCRPVHGVGGDFYHATARDGIVTVAMGDVSGHGARAARMMRATAPLCRSTMERDRTPRQVLEALDEMCCEIFPDDMFVTLACVSLDRAAGRLTVANAGHVVPVLRKATGEVLRLGNASGPPLGIGRHRGYTEEVFTLEDGDILVLMTDGVVDAIDSDPLAMAGTLEVVAGADHSAPAIAGSLSRRALRGNPACGVDDHAIVALEWVGRDPLAAFEVAA
jgi:serine phosphatase RsbU (regulator of sigma subunit)